MKWNNPAVKQKDLKGISMAALLNKNPKPIAFNLNDNLDIEDSG
jgi:hypothetical protein